MSGMDMLDTAVAYGDSEERLGAIGILDWRVVSKLPAVPPDCDDIDKWVSNAVDASLRRLRTKRLFALLLHRPQQLLEPEGDRLYGALQDLKRSGRVQKIGISIYDPTELDALCSRYTLDVVQSPLNIFDRRLAESGWLARLSRCGAELHVRSIFLQGLLLIARRERPKSFDRWSSLWARWDEWLAHHGLTPLQACLRYALSFDEISRVIVGVEGLGQLKAIVQEARGPLPALPDDLRCDDADLINPSRWPV